MYFIVFDNVERNLNPKAACLKRREEEKAEDGPKMGGHPLAPPPHLTQSFPSMPVPVSHAEFQ